MMYKHVDKFFKASKAAAALQRRVLRDEYSVTFIALFVLTKAMDATGGQ